MVSFARTRLDNGLDGVVRANTFRQWVRWCPSRAILRTEVRDARTYRSWAPLYSCLTRIILQLGGTKEGLTLASSGAVRACVLKGFWWTRKIAMPALKLASQEAIASEFVERACYSQEAIASE